MTKKALNDLLKAATCIAEEASAIPLADFSCRQNVTIKADGSPVTQTDKATEIAICDAIKKIFPDDGIYGEEFGLKDSRTSRTWVIDPIDGTKSFIAGIPLFGMLIALVEDNETLLGVVGFPALGEIYSGAKGLGARKNQRAISVSGCTDLSAATIFINEGERIYRKHPDLFSDLLNVGVSRRMSYDCYPHALLAEGRVDAVVDFDLKPYDYLPLVGLIEAAGGIVSDWSGNPLDFRSDGRIIATATPALHEKFLDLFRLYL